MLRFVVLSTLFACALGAAVSEGLVPLWQSRIVGGKDTTVEEYPYIVSMKYYGRHRCGGSIVSPNCIVTAAHCVKGVAAKSLTIVAGTSYSTSGGVQKEVNEIIIHAKYNSYTTNYDIALMFIVPLEFSESIQPIALAASNEVARSGSEATCSGWGALKEGGGSSNILQFVDVTVVSNLECQSAYGKRITEQMMCAGKPEGGKDACQGDSGGPLALGNALIGVVSWGRGCARKGYPGVYANIANLRNWIDENMK